ncbi:dihydrolipoyllysine-residue succinyltransferase [Buchnera aphidicola]|uniref:Dihydrolipoyllysine-residue succinyltransferase n=1 Tax=Buchnera aphidicola (Therioaphis trifolii) TaxID=1241884 RepID=A0A4D6YMM0_9GAMM|nr:dihydrolipoyllysine-residue succinyltransferase [Buchnera aphidicola]QCI27204.1 dihydrolipoyllysine-residue succinyltransferase [Buchnera aphidicola (Therioaphis trifolii)]
MNQTNILVPELPESINKATVVKWYKKIGDLVKQDEVLVDIETEKVILEVPSQVNGILIKILQSTGTIVHNKQILGYIKEIKENKNLKKNIFFKNKIQNKKNHFEISNNQRNYLSPSLRRIIATKNNLLNNSNNQDFKFNYSKKKKKLLINDTTLNKEHRVPITIVRKRIAERLLRTMHNTAMLTTFNEVNMKSIIEIRKKYSVLFQEKYNVKLGLMSFFVKSVVESLKQFPSINARIDNDEIVYYKFFDINIAISTNKGLVTPILKNADKMSMADIEKKIKYFVLQGNEGKLQLSDLLGGNFTITNGGTFGSLLSTPIINPPQTAILGIHAINNRVIAIDGNIKIAPMMYIALSYDHCMIDGKEAVSFLNMIKNILEDFSRILLNI